MKNGENMYEDHIPELKKRTVQAAKKEAQPVHGSLAGIRSLLMYSQSQNLQKVKTKCCWMKL